MFFKQSGSHCSIGYRYLSNKTLVLPRLYATKTKWPTGSEHASVYYQLIKADMRGNFGRREQGRAHGRR